MSDCSLSGSPPYDGEGCNLSGMDLSGKDLTGANLRNTTLTATIFAGVTSMAGADLTGATMSGTDFTGCDLSKTIFDTKPKWGSNAAKPTKLVRATIPFALLGRNWSYLDLTEANITGLPDELEQLYCSATILVRFRFAGKDLRNAHFYGVNLTSADFTGCSLANVVFGRGTAVCDLTRAKFNGALIPAGVFDTSTLTLTDFTGATMPGASLLQTRMDGTVFENVDLTTCSFSTPPRFSTSPNTITSLKNARINLAVLGKQWSYMDLTGTTIVGLTPAVDLTSLMAVGSRFGALDLSGYTLDFANFTDAKLDGTVFNRARLDAARFDGVSGSRATFNGTRMTGVSFQPGAAPVALHDAVFSNAIMTNANFHLADLSGAKFIQSLLHNATMTNMVLAKADLTGAQMGTQALLFNVGDPPEYQDFLKALGDENGVEVAKIFNAHGVAVTSVTVAAAAGSERNVWIVTETNTEVEYTVRKLSLGGQNVLSVFDMNALHANLGDTYMPGAVLTGANMYGMIASGVHLYGAGTMLDNAILENVDFSRANLGTANFKQAALNDAVLDDAVLTSAVFDGASLQKGQAGRGVSLQRANLQGAKFPDARLFGANLLDAAMCMPGSASAATSNGVWLDEVLPGEADYAAYVSELQAATALYSTAPSLEEQLQPGPVSNAFRVAFQQATKQQLGTGATVEIVQSDLTYQVIDDSTIYQMIHGIDPDTGIASYEVLPSTESVKPFYIPLADSRYFISGKPVAPQLAADFMLQGKVTLSSGATIGTFQRAVIWQISDITPYTLWDGFDLLSERMLFVRTALPLTTTLFQSIGVVLSRTTVTAMPDDGGWVMDNDSANPFSTQLGYVTFRVMQKAAGAALEVYGSTFRIERLTEGNQLQYYTINCDATQITAANFDANTVFPNGNKEPAVTGGKLLEAWLRASRPPKPPDCVPSPNSYCPAPAATRIGAVRRG